MSRTTNASWGLGKLALCTAVGVGLVAVPAAAGGNGKGKSRSAQTVDTSTLTTDDVLYYAAAGTSDPTNVPIVVSDLDAAAMVVPSLVVPPEEQMQAVPLWSQLRGEGMVVAVLDGGFNLNHPMLAGRLAPVAYDAINDRSDDDDVAEQWWVDPYAPSLVAAPEDPTVSATLEYEVEYDDGGYEVEVEHGEYEIEYEVVPTDDVNDFGDGYDNDRDGFVDEGLGHGTFVAGMVLRVAPEATILPIRVRDDEGYGLNTWVSRGLRYAIDQGVDVINMSIEAGDAWDYELPALLREAKAKGIVVVLSAGNDGVRQVSDMIWSANSLVVGAVDEFDRIADFSNYADLRPYDGGPRMVFAPGVDLCGPFGFPMDDANACWSGTSFAAPLVSGAVALARQANPGMLPDDIFELLGSSADTVFDSRGRKLRHSGRINVWNAVAR